MPAQSPYIRQIELLIYPHSETYKQAIESQAIKITSDGSVDSLYVRFRITRQRCGSLDQSEIVIKNLSEQTRRQLHPLCRVELRVGWRNYGLRTLYIGSLMAAVTQREGPDLVTRLLLLPAAEAVMTAVVSETFPPSMPVARLVTHLASKFPGVTVDAARIKVRGLIGVGGMSFAGTVRDLMDKLARCYGFSWTVIDGVFQALSDDDGFQRQMRISAKDGTLFRVSPILCGSLQLSTGIAVDSLLIPDLYPGDEIQLESDVVPELNGTWPLCRITYAGASHESEWHMHSECLKLAKRA